MSLSPRVNVLLSPTKLAWHQGALGPSLLDLALGEWMLLLTTFVRELNEVHLQKAVVVIPVHLGRGMCVHDVFHGQGMQAFTQSEALDHIKVDAIDPDPSRGCPRWLGSITQKSFQVDAVDMILLELRLGIVNDFDVT